MSKRLGKNLEDADSRRLWEAAERAAANRRKLVVPNVSADTKVDHKPDVESSKAAHSDDPEEGTQTHEEVP